MFLRCVIGAALVALAVFAVSVDISEPDTREAVRTAKTEAKQTTDSQHFVTTVGAAGVGGSGILLFLPPMIAGVRLVTRCVLMLACWSMVASSVMLRAVVEGSYYGTAFIVVTTTAVVVPMVMISLVGAVQWYREYREHQRNQQYYA